MHSKIIITLVLLVAISEASKFSELKKDTQYTKTIKTQDTCNHLCPHGIDLGPTGNIFSSEPSTFVAEVLLSGNGGKGGSGSGCCACSTQCSATSGCEAFLCAPNTASWTGFSGRQVNCQMFSATTPAPNDPSGIAGWWQHC